MPAELLTALDQHILTLTLNRPAARNSLSGSLVASLGQAVAAARSDPAVRVVVLTGAGDQAFCAGADLGAMAGASLEESTRRYRDLLQSLWDLGKPSIAAVNGLCLAGGLGLALACDLAVASEQAAFGTPEVKVGLAPMMVMALLQRHVGRKQALELIYTGEKVDARTAWSLGMVNRVVPHGELAAAVQGLAATLAAQSPVTLRLAREAFQAAADMAFGPALEHLHGQLGVIARTADAAEGIAAFLEKRPPRWQGQ